jgi:hypothetical protein
MGSYKKLIRLKAPIVVSEVPTGKILSRPNRRVSEFKAAITGLLDATYPNMPASERNVWCAGFFKVYHGDVERRVVSFKDQENRLIGAALYDVGSVLFEKAKRRYVYLISITISPSYQGYGIGKAACTKLLKESVPHLFLTSCTQSDMLHCCISSVQKGIVSGYHVVPRLETIDGQRVVVTVSRQRVPHVIEAFRQIYANLTGGDAMEIDNAVSQLSDTLVRRNMFGTRFSFDPWAKDKRDDILARALALKNGDGVLLVISKTELGS